MDTERDNAHAHCTHGDADRNALARRRTFLGHAAPFPF
jgi:hypothetical protein